MNKTILRASLLSAILLLGVSEAVAADADIAKLEGKAKHGVTQALNKANKDKAKLGFADFQSYVLNEAGIRPKDAASLYSLYSRKIDEVVAASSSSGSGSSGSGGGGSSGPKAVVLDFENADTKTNFEALQNLVSSIKTLPPVKFATGKDDELDTGTEASYFPLLDSTKGTPVDLSAKLVNEFLFQYTARKVLADSGKNVVDALALGSAGQIKIQYIKRLLQHITNEYNTAVTNTVGDTGGAVDASLFEKKSLADELVNSVDTPADFAKVVSALSK